MKAFSTYFLAGMLFTQPVVGQVSTSHAPEQTRAKGENVAEDLSMGALQFLVIISRQALEAEVGLESKLDQAGHEFLASGKTKFPVETLSDASRGLSNYTRLWSLLMSGAEKYSPEQRVPYIETMVERSIECDLGLSQARIVSQLYNAFYPEYGFLETAISAERARQKSLEYDRRLLLRAKDDKALNSAQLTKRTFKTDIKTPAAQGMVGWSSEFRSEEKELLRTLATLLHDKKFLTSLDETKGAAQSLKDDILPFWQTKTLRDFSGQSTNKIDSIFLPKLQRFTLLQFGLGQCVDDGGKPMEATGLMRVEGGLISASYANIYLGLRFNDSERFKLGLECCNIRLQHSEAVGKTLVAAKSVYEKAK